ncbi:GAF domain-containing protein [Nonomuraea solani]|uniref:GAF domain-containing protein n=2 Tax=Nonomuraea solani TaxID=1144553 RepID=A0A1H6BUI1_9ACTN|nr:GAF domain-containing protein [Nonomuraea solani]
MSPSFGAGLERNVIAAQALAAIVPMIGADMGNVQLLDPVAGGLKIVAQRGFGRQFLHHFEVVRGGDSICGRAMSEGRAVLVPDIERDAILARSSVLAVLTEAGVRTVISAPMFDPAGSTVGMVSLHYRWVRRLSANDQHLLELLVQRTARVLLADRPR